MNVLQTIALILVVIGGINWLLVGLFKFDLVAAIAGGMKFGSVNLISRIIYILVGIAAIYAITILFLD